MNYSFNPPKTNIQNGTQFDTYDINNDSKILSHYETETNLDNAHSSESLSNIIDVISNNNLNLFYQDDSNNFKRNIDNLNLKFYLETEKILSSNSPNSNNLFLILFKQITLYIKEIERLNVIILGMKKDEQSEDKMASFMEKRKVDFEMKEHIIKALKYSNNTLEKKISNLILSESNLKQENLRLIKENMFYKNNNSSNTNINNKNKNKSILLNQNDNTRFNISNDKNKNKKNVEFEFNHSNFKKNNSKITKNKSNTNNNSISNNNKIIKINKENNYKITKNNENNSKNIIISVKRDENLLLKRHRRNYSDQIGIGVIIQDNSKNNNNDTKKIKNNVQIKTSNKNNIISMGASTPKANPIQFKNNHLCNVIIKENTKNKNNKNVKDDINDNKIFIKKKTDLSTKSKHIDFLNNQDKDCSITKYSSSIFNKSYAKSIANGNISINITENNYDFLIDSEIDDLSMMENLLNEIKDYIKSNISTTNANTHSTQNIIKINCNNNSHQK